MRYLSIDIETGGLNPKNNDILEIGGVLEDTERLVPLDSLPYFRLLVHPRDDLGYYRLQPFAAGMNADLLKQIKEFPGKEPLKYETTLIKPQFVADWIMDWVARYGITSIIAAGKNFASFDRPFLAELPSGLRFPAIKFKHRSLDPSMYYLKSNDTEPPNLQLCCERAGIDLQGFQLHTAVDDAKLVVELIRRGMRKIEPPNPRREGELAKEAGKAGTDNPYDPMTSDQFIQWCHTEWNTGWLGQKFEVWKDK